MNTCPLSTTLLAAAAVLAATPAVGQTASNVTLYGLIDVNASHYSAGSASGASNDWRLNDGVVNGLNGSRWGIRVTEDLGSGLKANVLAESGFSADTGALGQGGLAFGRQVFIGLSQDGVGELRLGRQYVLSDSVMALTNPFGNAAVNNQGTAVTNAGRNLPFWLNAPRANNVIQLNTASFGGFVATAQFAPQEGTADRFHGVKLAYGNGPLNLALSYEWNKSIATGDNTNKSLTIGVNYNFGMLKLVGGVQRNQDLRLGAGNGAFIGSNLDVTSDDGTFTADQTKGYTLGVEVPIGQWTIGANYSGVTYEGAAGDDATLGKAAVTARYGLSKTTFLYSGISFATGDLKDHIAEERVFQLGLRKAW